MEARSRSAAGVKAVALFLRLCYSPNGFNLMLSCAFTVEGNRGHSVIFLQF